MDSLLALRAAVGQDPNGFQVLNGSSGSPVSLDKATVLRITSTGTEFALDDKTAFESTNPELGFIDLKTVVNCWVSRELSVPQYIASSDELGIPNLKFLERTDLVEWLEGSSDDSEYIKSTSGDEKDVEMADGTDISTGGIVGGEPAARIGNSRGTLVNHSTVLHGYKNVEFGNIASLSHQYLVSDMRKPDGTGRSSQSQGSSAGSGVSLPPLRPAKGKDPIILLSPSPSSLLNMANVQDFLGNGVFNPVLKNAGSANLLRITRNSNLIGPNVKFVVVDSVDQFKPEYWDRVVAVFVTGQSWQLRGYKWHDPHTLFQHVAGFSINYKNDPVPESLKQWNVKIETVDRTARFRDREVMERIWERIENYMISRGWPVHGTV